MNQKLYLKLAYNNIRRNSSTFAPFLIATITMVSVFYLLTSVWIQCGDMKFSGATSVALLLNIGVYITAILAVGIVFYTNSFLMKRRTKELGLYNILGMEKKHISRVVFWEISMVAGCGIFVGLVAGMLFARLMILIFYKMIRAHEKITIVISIEAIGLTVALFATVFLIDIIYNRIHIARMKPVDLLSGDKKGEKEPKAKWISTILGIISLGVGYYLAQTTDNPVNALGRFFVAVLFVIAGTYLLFLAVSIVVLKALKKNKKYYYHPTHFITVSDMIYRMKQNAVGLANICIFSTAVLVVLSTTVSLYLGIEDEIRLRFPRDVYVKVEPTRAEIDNLDMVTEKVIKQFDTMVAEDEKTKSKDVQQYHQWEMLSAKKNGRLLIGTKAGELYPSGDMVMLTVLPAPDYNRMFHTKYKVAPGQVIASVQSGEVMPEKDVIHINNQTYQVAKEDNSIASNVISQPYNIELVLLVSDVNELQQMVKDTMGNEYDPDYTISWNYRFDLSGGSVSHRVALCEKMTKQIEKAKLARCYMMEDSYTNRESAIGLYSSMLFIGVFIGVLFLIATVLIIYYKQISEGYEDRNNFMILQKVGLSKHEVKKIINNQMRIVFFLPILVAVVHISVAFKIINSMLLLLNLSNTTLFIQCTMGTILVFILFYIIVYRLTSKIYYRIVNK